MVQKQTAKEENKHIFDGLSNEEIIEQISRDPPDPLYARIESEPIHDNGGYEKDANGKIVRKKGGNGSSIRQIIINLNVANMTKYDSGKHAGEYSDRPIFFYYTGPEKYDTSNKNDPNYQAADYYNGYNKLSNHVRDSLPVIINFNKDFRGIFFFPNSPVVINGNQKNFEGYVIAKEFVMLKTYEDDEFSYNGIGDFVYDEKNKVYYDISTLTTPPDIIENAPDFTKITYTQNGELVEKYILNSDLKTYALTEANVYNSVCYRKDESGTADSFARAAGYIKVDYYSSPNKDGSTWPDKVGTSYFDPSNTRRFVYFPKSYALPTNQGGKNWSYTGKNSVWRAKDENGWLDERDEYRDRYMVNWGNDKVILYDTAAEVLSSIGGYTQISGSTDWKKNDATEYMAVSANGTTYYLPKSLDGIKLYDGKDPAPSAANKIAIKYYDNGTEKDGYADLRDNPKKYYLMYQDDIQGNDTTTDNPMFVDELGNVQYRHKRDGSGKEIDKNVDGSVAYETIEPTISPGEDPALVKRAIEDAVNELIVNYSKEETENLKTTEDKIEFLEKKDKTAYDNKVAEYFKRDFPYLLDGTVKFFNKDDFNLASSLFDNFQLVKMTQYSYLNEHGASRSINNLFTVDDAERRD